MKKILLATTALVGFAGAAAAEVALTGYAEIGIAGGNGDVETQFWNDIDVTFKLSGETDGGLTFGATIDIDELRGNSIPATTVATNKSSVFVSGAFGKITMGDTDGALDWALTEIYRGTALADDHSSHAGAYWNSGLDGIYDGQVARYEYSFGDFAAAVSAEMDDTGVGDAALGLGVKWSGDLGGTAVGAGLAYQSNGDIDIIGVSADATLANGILLNAGYVDLDNGADWTGVAVGYQTGALLVQANYGVYSLVGGDVDGWGLVANYDLGGGAVVMAGYGSGDINPGNNEIHGQGGVDTTDTFSLGLGLSF